MKHSSNSKGFSLLELMVVIAIVGVLASIAVPQYSRYTNKAKFSKFKVALAPIKIQLIECYTNNGGASCNTSADTPTVDFQVTTAMLNHAASSGDIASITVTPDGGGPKITVIPHQDTGFAAADTYELIGKVSASGASYITDWEQAGGGCSKGYC